MRDLSRRATRPPLRATARFLLAYVTTFTVLLSYAWFNWKCRLFGAAYREGRLGALHARNAARIEETILKLQGLFIKVGQLFSIMTNFLPADLRSGLENLQDAVPGRPYSQIERRVREELGKAPLEVFAAFAEEPIASASLGQVHEATTKDGRRVAVKVQHLGVEAMAKSDLRTIQRIIGLVKRFLDVRGLDNFYSEIRQMVLEELDFQHEATHIEEIARNFIGNDKVVFPRVLTELSTSRILTLEFVEGVKITDRDRLVAAGIDPVAVARDLVTVYCQMIFIDGVYHADPHPGNVLVQEGGRLVLLDFGAVGHLSPVMRQGISAFFEAIIKADEKQLLQSLRTMGFLQTGTNQAEAAARVIEHFHRKFQEEIRLDDFSLSSIKIDTQRSLESLADLRQMDLGIRELSSAFHVPKEWVLLERAALLLAGICTHLDPAMNPAAIIRPYLEEFVLGKDRDWSVMLFDFAREKIFSFLALPAQIDKALSRTLAGQVRFRVEGIGPGVERLYAAGHQLVFTVLASVSAGVGVYFHSAGELRFARWSAYAAAAFVGLIFLSMLRARRYKAKRGSS